MNPPQPEEVELHHESTLPASIEIDSSQFAQMMSRLSDIQTTVHDDVVVFGNLILGLLVGYIAIRGLLNPWNKSS